MKDDMIHVISTDENDKGLKQSDVEKYANRLIAGYIIVVGGCLLYGSITGIRRLRQNRKKKDIEE